MKALYPGTFDPIHFGHIDIAARASSMFDHLVVGVYAKPSKNLLFSVDERVAMAKDALKGLKNVEVLSYEVLTVEFASRIGADVIVRGLRVISDFELEFQMALTNRSLVPEIDTICLITSQQYNFISSSIVKEVALLHGDVSGMVTPAVARALYAKADGGTNVNIVSLRD